MSDGPTAAALKRYRDGTHRLCDPAETYARVEPLMPMLGISRVADITRLDRIGIPVWQAIRPNSRSMSIAQGKGTTAIAAKVSAVMESAELWHAERVPPPSRVARLAEIEAELGYDVFGVRQLDRSLLNGGMRLDWLDAERMDGSGPTFVPRDSVSLDGRVVRRWAPPVFFANSNGLASGNSVDEAALHGLCEVLERDGLARLRAAPSRADRIVDPDSVDAPAATELLERLAHAGMRAQVVDARGPTELPCFEVVIRSDDHPHAFRGAGCHLDPTVALCRALTEAAQSRLIQIAGSGDDVTGSFRRDARRAVHDGTVRTKVDAGVVSFGDIMSFAADGVEEDLDLVIGRVKAQAGVSPILVDLSREDIGIAVVKVVTPGLVYDISRSEARVDLRV